MWQKVTYDWGDRDECWTTSINGIDVGDWPDEYLTTSINGIDVIWDGISQFEFYTDIENGDPQTLTLGRGFERDITSKKKLYKIAKDFIEDMRGELW